MNTFAPDFLNALCVKVARQLNKLPYELGEAEKTNQSEPYLIFPATADGNIRVSEQEARFLLTQQLEQCGIHYAVETPTLLRYQFSGTQSERSGSTDVTLFEASPDGSKFIRKTLIELKAHNVHQRNVEKDFEKLLQEKEPGLFFHILQAANSGTLTADSSEKGVLVKYRNAFKTILDKLPLKKDQTWFLHLVLFCMSPCFLISKTIRSEDLSPLAGFFDFQYKISNGAMVVTKRNGWNVLDFQDNRSNTCSCPLGNDEICGKTPAN
ncbi:MAG: hypothetical protein Q3M24_16385 [Candidatus Electrothrix aestuarii]|uniref:Uncharacterized protein n=1 Tax=Candidatus Electrothrix aestuarii TaxID=3062594 RepID=A0AAU8LRE3_9BACT|nr:hypothetical protein [Candidatus Electrothrix aestuarii]